jgi:aspartokinase
MVKELEIRQLLLKSGLSDIALRRNERTITLVESTRQKTDFDAGETLIETLGDHEINVVTEERIAGELLRNVSEKDVLRHYERVCELCIYITENMSRVPGVFAVITLHLAANDINVLECFSTLTEFSVVVEQEDAQRAYAALQELVAESSKARKR